MGTVRATVWGWGSGSVQGPCVEHVRGSRRLGEVSEVAVSLGMSVGGMLPGGVLCPQVREPV